jgi:hypothetical protein
VQRGLGAQQAKDLLNNRLGTIRDPFSQQIDTGTAVDPALFDLAAARATFTDKAALDNWIIALADAAQDPNKPLPAGKPTNTPSNYTISLNAPQNGSITGNTSISAGQTAQFTLSPNANYSLDVISGCNGTLSTDKTTYTTAAIAANCSITASFSPTLTNQTATNGTAYSLNMGNYINGTASSYTLTGTLPTGLTFDSTTGQLSGTATQTGTYTISIVANYNNSTSSIAKDFTLTVAAPPPTATLSKTADALEGNTLTFTVTLDAAANGTTTANISYSAPSPLPSGTTAATGAASCTGTADYTNGTTSVDIPSGDTSATFTVPTCANASNLQASSVKVTISSISGNAQLSSTASNVSKEAIIHNTTATGKLNDTGVLLYGTPSTAGTQSNSLEATDPNAATPAQQDAAHGRDAQAQAGTLAKVGSSSQNAGKNNGFDFTKISSTGQPLAADATSWDCVLDNHTGLMWENKTDDGGLRDKDNTYTWYNTDSTNNGGHAGTANGGTCTGGTGCDTEKYVSDVNTAGLCGYTNWRMPTVEELQSIVDMGRVNPAIDPTYFLSKTDWSEYFSSQSTSYFDPEYEIGSIYVWSVFFYGGGDASFGWKSSDGAVRVVRSQ